MHVISYKKLKEFFTNNRESEIALDTWYRIMKTIEPQSIAGIKEHFPSADAVGRRTVFNVGGNKYRIITRINYRFQRIYILYVLTHKEYDLEKWK